MDKQKKTKTNLERAGKSQRKLARTSCEGSSMKNANQFLHFISNPAINGNDL